MANSGTGPERRQHWDLSPRELMLILAFWTSLALLSAVNRLIDPRGFGFRFGSPAAPIALAFVEAWFWAAVTPLVFWLSHRITSEQMHWAGRIALLLLAGVAIAIVAYIALESIRIEVLPMTRRRPVPVIAPLRELGRFRFVNQLVVYAAILAAGFAREYFVRDQARQREASELRAQLTEARLDALRMQLNPHFLFNTLHAISALAERDPAAVRKMIARLSELLRASLERQGETEIPLREELAFLDKYLEIMAVRFEGRLRVTREIDPAVLDALVPPFVLQPILENAMEHGVSRIEGEGRVGISAERAGEHVLVSIHDNGPGMRGTATSEGLGIGNTRSRLAHMYGTEAALDLSSPAEGGTRVVVRVPFHTKADLRTAEK